MPDALLRLAYLGREFHGSQYQPGLATVEGTLRTALAGLGAAPRMASRTDRGVNALGNVALVPTELPPAELAGRLVERLAAHELWVTGHAPAPARSPVHAPDGFRPRHAHRRHYRYLLYDAPDLHRLRAALALFVGDHDFRRFCRPEGPTRAVVTGIAVAPADADADAPAGDCAVIDITGRAFLWQQVRRMVGAAADVARGRRTRDELAAALAGAEADFSVAPPEFLTLTAVEYRDVEFAPMPPPRGMARRARMAAAAARFLRELVGD